MNTTPHALQGSPELEVFAATLAAKAVDYDSYSVAMVVAVDDPPHSILILPLHHDDPGGQAMVDQLLADPRRSMVGALMPLAWSPDAGPTRPAWCLVAVRSAEPAIFGVRRVAEDELWWRLPVSEMPWLVASTAASLRAALRGRPLTFKTTMDPRMFQRPGEGEPPPTDERGLL